MKKPFVFISYSTKEAETANLVYSYLEGNGVNCWIASRNIEGGESFAAQIATAISECAAFVVIASSYANSSDHVSNEIALAMDDHKKIIPFRTEDFKLSAANRYLLIQAQWIDAFKDMNAALKHLLTAVRTALPQEALEKPTVPTPTVRKKVDATDVDAALPTLSRDEIVELLLKKIEKFPYCLRDRTYPEVYDAFKKLAGTLFDKTVSMYFKGHMTAGGVDFVDIIVDTLSQGQGISVHVKGLPGCAKNMLLQLAYYKMLENFRHGESDYLPIYLSSSYYEKQPYDKNDARGGMTALIKEETREYFAYLRRNPNVHPVLLVEAVREHIVSSFAPEDVMMELFSPFGKFNRIVAVDVGLIKNHLRLKRTIPLMGDATGYAFHFHSIPITNQKDCLIAIRAILDMYREQYEGLEEKAVYSALFQLQFPTIDIFTVRLVATELSRGRSPEDVSLIDMYERLALTELKGDEDKMLVIANELFEYVFNESHNAKTKEYNGVLWSLPHKHDTYLDFMVAYYLCHSVLNADKTGDFDFMHSALSSMGNRFMTARLYQNYPLQERFLSLAVKHYHEFDISQKSNIAFWLGKLTYAELKGEAEALLEAEYRRLKPVVKGDNHRTLDNLRNQYLYRAISYGLIECKRTNVLDDYLCHVITNDMASVIDRGTVIQQMGEGYQGGMHNDFYLDTDLKIGEQTIRILASNVESKLLSKKSGYVETALVSLLTLIQARMHTSPENLPYSLAPYCEIALSLLSEYQKRPRSIISDKLLYYFTSIEEDLRSYVEYARFDAGFTLYTALTKMKETKRSQWLAYGIEDPESVAEHTLSAWLMAMIFLPSEANEQDYNKQEILDMLMIHDMADGILGDLPSQLSEPTRELKAQNSLMRTLFLKGTYPEVANLTHYYNVWVGYFKAQNINARIARDVNLVQTVNTFFDYFTKNPMRFTPDMIHKWLDEGNKLSTDVGYDLFERVITKNPIYRKAIDNRLNPPKTQN